MCKACARRARDAHDVLEAGRRAGGFIPPTAEHGRLLRPLASTEPVHQPILCLRILPDTCCAWSTLSHLQAARYQLRARQSSTIYSRALFLRWWAGVCLRTNHSTSQDCCERPPRTDATPHQKSSTKVPCWSSRCLGGTPLARSPPMSQAPGSRSKRTELGSLIPLP